MSEKRTQKEIRRQRRKQRREGKLARVAAVVAAMKSKDFDDRLNAAIETAGDSATTNHDVRRIVLATLDAMGISHSGVSVTLAWDPSSRRLDLFARPKITVKHAPSQLRAVANETPPQGLSA